jgi:hypothetical protein
MSQFTDRCPSYAPFFGVMGATSAMVFTGMIKLKLKCRETYSD